MAREITIMTPEQVELRFELAGIGSRFIALLLDTLLQGLMMLVLVLPFMIGGLSFEINGSAWGIAIVIMAIFVITNGYFLFFEVTKNGQTPGKKAAGIRVVRDTGHPVDFRSGIIRNLLRTVDSLPGIYGVAIVSVFFSPQYRRLGDYVGGTLVVKVGRSLDTIARQASAMESDEETAAVNQSSFVLPPEAMPFISAIERDEYRTIRHFLDRRNELELHIAQDLSSKLSEPIAKKLHMEHSLIEDETAFLLAVSTEWERRRIR